MRFPRRTPTPMAIAIEPPARRLVRREHRLSHDRRFNWQDKMERGENERLVRLAQQLHIAL